MNSLIGYRTNRSMINEDTWNFANQTMSSLCILWGIVLVFVTAGLDVLFYKQMETMSLVLVFMQLIPLFICIIQVEKKLKETFDENGKRRFK
ncbi:MAG: SdpI family protein [Floccifex sp.]